MEVKKNYFVVKGKKICEIFEVSCLHNGKCDECDLLNEYIKHCESEGC